MVSGGPQPPTQYPRARYLNAWGSGLSVIPNQPMKGKPMKPNPTTFADSIDRISESIDNAIISTVHRMDDDADLNLDNILVTLAEAHAYVIQTRVLATVADRILAQPPEPTVAPVAQQPKGELPPLQPQGHTKPVYRKGVQKALKKPKDFECPACRAEVGTNCFKFEGPGQNPKLTTERNDGSFFHGKRTALAAAANKTIRKNFIVT